MWLMWLLVIILLTALEVVTINLFSIWFIISGIVSLFLSFAVDSFYIQFGVFVGLGIILMLLTRPYLVKKLSKKKVRTNFDRIIGKKGLVTEKIEKLTVGEVKVDGKRWSAISKDVIAVGSTVIIEDIDGVKLIVRKDEE